MSIAFYQLAIGGVFADGTFVPEDDGNALWREYVRWMADGNVAGPMSEFDWRSDVWTEFRSRRDLYLSRLSDIAGRYSRQGNAEIPAAADSIAVGLLAMQTDPTLQTAETRVDLEKALVSAANRLLRAQLTDPTTAPAIKAALDQIFKA